jgi:hypothetical protein
MRVAPLGIGLRWSWRFAVRCRLYRIPILIGHRAVGAVFHGTSDCGEEPSIRRTAAIRRKVFVAFAVTVTPHSNPVVAPA